MYRSKYNSVRMIDVIYLEETMTLKILLVGDSNVGKSTFANRHLTGEFTKKHKPDTLACVYPLDIMIKGGIVEVDLWVVPSASIEHFYDVDGVILMYDGCDPTTIRPLPSLHDKVLEASPGAKTVLVGNKYDEANQKVEYFDPKIKHIRCSAMSNLNYMKPFIYLIKQITGDEVL